MSFYDPLEQLDEADRNDFAVRQHLYAQRALRDLEQGGTKEKVAKMLAAVVPGPKVCGHISGKDEGRKRCGAPGVRMVALTGDWFCEGCDPLRQIHWGRSWSWMATEEGR